MKMGNRMVILITLILSTSYIFGIDYYDKKETKIKDLYTRICSSACVSSYACISSSTKLSSSVGETLSEDTDKSGSTDLPAITYSGIDIELSGIKYGQILNAREIALRQSRSINALSHTFDCSKLCTQIHINDIDTDLIREQNTLGILAESKNAGTPFNVSIKTQKDIGYNTYYKIKIQGKQDISQLDNLRSRSKSLLSDWNVRPKERIYFTGKITGQMSSSQREDYVRHLLKNLNASETDHYQDDYSEGAEAYYGYTKDFKEYILGEKGKKTNIQISFSYNEYDGSTQVIIAFPFYNEPF